MSKFELSDKELKQLLQNEGLEEPSLSFNRIILEKAAAYDKAKSLKVPLGLKILFTLLMAIPIVLILWNGGVHLGLGETMNAQKIQLPSANLNFTLDKVYLYFMAMTVGVVWLSVFFYKMLRHNQNGSVKNG